MNLSLNFGMNSGAAWAVDATPNQQPSSNPLDWELDLRPFILSRLAQSGRDESSQPQKSPPHSRRGQQFLVP